MDTRLIVAWGFFGLGCALLFAEQLTPTPTYTNLVMIRSTQTFALGFMFVPISTIAYSTLPKQLSSDATSLFIMFRNVAGSIGISTTTAMVTQRSQVHMAYLSSHLGAFNRGFQLRLQSMVGTLQGLGHSPLTVHATALGLMRRSLMTQASVLAYIDVFRFSAAIAFLVVPFCFLFRAGRIGGKASPPAH